MRVLMLAPHPFYQERGTPIDVLLVLRVLTERADVQVDLLTYPEGEDVDLPGLRIFRTPALPGLSNIPPGFSLKKSVCDVLLLVEAWKRVRATQYDVIHAGEEAVYLAMALQWLYDIPYAYDLDSSLAQQLVEQVPALKGLEGLLNGLERRAIQQSLIAFPVCNALAERCQRLGARKTVTLHDISPLDSTTPTDPSRLHRELAVGEDTLFLYSGNLQPYQGIDLLLEAFRRALDEGGGLFLVVMGGRAARIAQYREKAARLGIDETVSFLGPRPLEHLGDYLAGADVLVCPRVRGLNTPMKLFPYLHSGRPVLATALRTHTQLLTSDEAYLAPATPEGFAAGMRVLARSPSLRHRLGRTGRALVEQNHTFAAHRERLNRAYDWIRAELTADTAE
jgi:glycosyltransferase involved in cell wall biosynthesis